MILQHTATVRISSVSQKHWESLGYFGKCGTEILVSTSDLQPHSQVNVLCACDDCGKQYQQRISRDTNICGSCRRAARPKKSYKKSRYDVPEKQILLDHISNGMGKTDISKYYKTTLARVNGWILYHDISLPKYFGRLYFKTAGDRQRAILEINKLVQEKVSISEIVKSTGTPRHIIKMLHDAGAVNVVTLLDVWKISYESILENIEFYKKENNTKNLRDISLEHDISYEQLKKAFVETNTSVKLHSYNKSVGEKEICKFVNDLGVICYSKMLQKTYEIDCYVPSHNFGIEYCGEYWHRYDHTKNNKNYHLDKYRFCALNNINVMTVFANEWNNKRDIIKSMIKSRLGLNERIYARKTQIKIVDSLEAKAFHELNHVSGSINCSVNIGLYYEDKLVTVLSMLKSRFDKSFEYEIGRYSTQQGFVVVGGLSKMFKYFIDNYKPHSCVTYSDLRFGEGNSYLKIGFEKVGNTPPNYSYYNGKLDKLESRFKYQKHKLKNMIGYSDTKTEFEIMSDNKFYRVYDCGNNKFSWINAATDT